MLAITTGNFTCHLICTKYLKFVCNLHLLWKSSRQLYWEFETSHAVVLFFSRRTHVLPSAV